MVPPHPAFDTPTTHPGGDYAARYGPWRDDARNTWRGVRPARRASAARALVLIATLGILPIGLVMEPGWGRFLALIGLLHLGALVAVTWCDPVRLRGLALKTAYVVGFAAYVATLFV